MKLARAVVEKLRRVEAEAVMMVSHGATVAAIARRFGLERLWLEALQERREVCPRLTAALWPAKTAAPASARSKPGATCPAHGRRKTAAAVIEFVEPIDLRDESEPGFEADLGVYYDTLSPRVRRILESKAARAAKQRDGWRPRPRKYSVLCVETGVVYDSHTEAAAAVGVTQPSITRAVRRRGTCAGYHWVEHHPPGPVEPGP